MIWFHVYNIHISNVNKVKYYIQGVPGILSFLVIADGKQIVIKRSKKNVGSSTFFGYDRALKLHLGKHLVASVHVTPKVNSSTAVTLPCSERKKKT